MSLISQAKLKQYLSLEYNVLFIGLHGIGKTSVIKEVFSEMYGEINEGWKYFSASTLDPWVDFVGVPEVNRLDGKKTLELVRPDWCQDANNIQAIMLDEFNRAPDKVINAVMELIQFKSINGHKLPNLKVVWAAINPEDDDDTYSVNHLDPAQLDRFQVHLNIPYKIDEEYFMNKYPNTAPIFIQWWKDMPGDIQKLVSPRRVDYAADAHSKGCRLEDFLPVQSNVAALRSALKSLPFHALIKNVSTDEEAVSFISDINNSTKLLDLVKQNDTCAVDFFKKYGKKMPKELIEPFIENVIARNKGFDVVASLEEMINKLPESNGNQGTAALINNVHLAALYKNGGSLENDIRALNTTKKHVLMKLTNRCCDVIANCRAPTLDKVLWGIEGKKENHTTNFNEIIVAIAKVGSSLPGGIFTPRQIKQINDKLYNNKIVDNMNYLPSA